ncbi:MAG: hypothetical protein ACOYU3_09335 [Bacillota bacterium]
MKKAWGICLSLVLLFLLTACGTKSPFASQGVFETGTPVAATTMPTPAPTPVLQTSTPVVSTPSPIAKAYEIKTDDFSYQKNNCDFKASYPQLVSSALPNLADINARIKDSALETINASYGLDDGSTTTIETTGTVTYSDPDFISITFNEYYNNSLAAHPWNGFRTLNINLKDGSTVTLKDMIKQSKALYQALLNAANEQLSDYLADEITLDIIKDGFYSDTIYFTPDRVGFSLEVFHVMGDHLELTLPYDKVKPFITGNKLWNKFI